MIGDTWVAELRERSKNDHAIIVGSEVRQLCGEVDRLRAALSASEERAARAEALHAEARAREDQERAWHYEQSDIAHAAKKQSEALALSESAAVARQIAADSEAQSWQQRALAAEADAERIRGALERLTVAVENMRVPKTVEEAFVQVMITVGPAVTAARAALEGGGRNGR